jgi:hypothetical protein
MDPHNDDEKTRRRLLDRRRGATKTTNGHEEQQLLLLLLFFFRYKFGNNNNNNNNNRSGGAGGLKVSMPAGRLYNDSVYADTNVSELVRSMSSELSLQQWTGQGAMLCLGNGTTRLSPLLMHSRIRAALLLLLQQQQQLEPR